MQIRQPAWGTEVKGILKHSKGRGHTAGSYVLSEGVYWQWEKAGDTPTPQVPLPFYAPGGWKTGRSPDPVRSA